MGIPSYFSYVLKNHVKIIKRLQDVKCNQLFIDANSLIYDVVKESHENIYENVYQKILNLINKLNPEFTFVAFDGVAPLAKMKQQKQRRYKSYIVKQIIPSKSWNTNAITPGTTFMNELDAYLEDKYKNNPHIKFSGSNQVGEGEHKIMDYMRTNKCSDNQFIYGLDADLIMLGLLHLKHNKNVYLYRETCHFSYLKNIDSNQDYVFSLIEMENQINDFGIKVDDYCFLCFLFGNDFMPHFPSLNIRNDGIPYLLEVYKKLNIQLVSSSINWNSFRLLCLELMKHEDERIKMNIEWKKKLKVHPLTAEEELNVLPVRDRSREEYLGKNLSQYYKFLFGQDEKNPCTNYLQMLEWTWFYYNGTCKDYYIMYEFSHAPLFKSLVNYIPCFEEDLVQVNPMPPPMPITQLIYVLPYQDYQLVPMNTKAVVKEYPNLSETYFPIHYEFCKFFWESHVNFNYINIVELNKYIKVDGNARSIE
jgi:5'-3' exonuclease